MSKAFSPKYVAVVEPAICEASALSQSNQRFCSIWLNKPFKTNCKFHIFLLFYSSGDQIFIPACEKGTALDIFILINIGVIASKHLADVASPAL